VTAAGQISPASPTAPATAPAAPAESVGSSAGAGTAQPAVAVPDQVLQHLTSVRALREGGHRTVLRLDPEHLGEVTLTVDVRGGSVRLAVSGGAEAVGAVHAGLAHLRSSLAESGLSLGDVALRPDGAATGAGTGTGTDPRDSAARAFTTPDGSTSGGPGRDGRTAGGDGRGGRHSDGRSPDTGTVPAPVPAPRPAPRARTTGSPGRLDVRV
jgi:hypothetical protein